jgi:hypothetical protein
MTWKKSVQNKLDNELFFLKTRNLKYFTFSVLILAIETLVILLKSARVVPNHTILPIQTLGHQTLSKLNQFSFEN